MKFGKLISSDYESILRSDSKFSSLRESLNECEDSLRLCFSVINEKILSILK
jgi:hypothetical protein